MRAVELAQAEGEAEAEGGGPGGPAWSVPKVYWVVIPERAARAMLSALLEAGQNPVENLRPDGPLPSMVTADELVTTVVDGTRYLEAKAAALRAHATQIAVDGPFFALSNGIRQPMLALEHYRLVRGVPGGPKDADGRETDLFAGVAALGDQEGGGPAG
jgi:N-acetyl-1-D-myo-inositol-2-amino-2-deoxy-alpha-D-glucopyranoside deacetylase